MVPVSVNRLVKFAAVVAALGVLWVLVTPAFDELPCTAGHKSFKVWALVASATPIVFQPLLSNHGPVHVVFRVFVAVDVLSLTCSFLC